jgi:hypothetical protein
MSECPCQAPFHSVINALKKGLDIETIAAITELSKEEILEIKNSL